MHIVMGNISEANVLELLENLEEIFLVSKNKVWSLSSKSLVSEWLTLYVAVTQFTYGKLRHSYVKS